MSQAQQQFNASVVAELSDREIDDVTATCNAMAEPGPATVAPGQFIFFGAFDGTNNKATDLPLSGTFQHTNVAQLWEQVNDQRNLHAGLKSYYYPGVGTGGDTGDFDARTSNPTPYIAATAEKAYRDFASEADAWLTTARPSLRDDVTVAVTGFSRGAATAVAFARLVNDRGLEFDGRVLIPPGLVRVAAMLLLDPVYTGVEMDLRIPANATGHVSVVRARHEFRYMFRAADYSVDSRVRSFEVPGNHGNVGGMYDNGIGALVLESATRFFGACGVPIGNVPVGDDPPRRCCDRDQPFRIYSEGVDRYKNRVWSESGNFNLGSTRLTTGLNNTKGA